MSINCNHPECRNCFECQSEQICTHETDSYGYPINVPGCPVCEDWSKRRNDAYTYAAAMGFHDPDRYMRGISRDRRGYDEAREAAERSQDYETGKFNG